MHTKRGAGLVSIFVLVLLLFSFSPKVQAPIVYLPSVSINPSKQHAKMGTECAFNVTVKNTDRSADNFSLVASDNLGWGLMVSENLIEVSENGSGTVTLTVTLPENIELYTEDNILVTATSQREPAIISSASCKAAGLLGVTLHISPSENTQSPGGTATFMITVANTGEYVDNYRLKAAESASTSQSWKPTFGENSFVVAPGENRTTTLTMKVPMENLEQGDWSTVTVTVTSQTDDSTRAVLECTAVTPMETNWNYFYTGIGIVVVAGVIVVMLWKGPLAGG